MTDRFSLDQSERLFGAVSIGGTLGAIFGPWLASVLAKPMGTPFLLLVAAGFLLLAVCAAWLLTQLQDEQIKDVHSVNTSQEVIGGGAWEGLWTVLRSPYLLGISGYVLIVAIIATFIYFTRLQMVAALGVDTDTRTATFAQIDLISQITTLILQAFVTSHLMKRFGVPFTLALLPICVALGFIGLAIFGSLAALIALDATFRAVQRGVMRPARETLFTTMPRAERYKSKAFIDTFVYRGGDVVGAQTEGLLGRLGMGLAGLATFAVPLALLWMALGIWLGVTQRHRALQSTSTSTKQGENK
jgi:AAA family ATP:ADP antiporter